jgi:hypothetical protein
VQVGETNANCHSPTWPGFRPKLAHRAFISRTLRQLGLSLETVRPVGRPTAWRKQQEQRDAEG